VNISFCTSRLNATFSIGFGPRPASESQARPTRSGPARPYRRSHRPGASATVRLTGPGRPGRSRHRRRRLSDRRSRSRALKFESESASACQAGGRSAVARRPQAGEPSLSRWHGHGRNSLAVLSRCTRLGAWGLGDTQCKPEARTGSFQVHEENSSCQ
jgi:hypothetical protein